MSVLLNKKNLLIHDFFLHIIIKNSASKNKTRTPRLTQPDPRSL